MHRQDSITIKRADYEKMESELLALRQFKAEQVLYTERLEAEKLALKRQLAEMQRLIFGRKSERFVPETATPGQLRLVLDGLEEIVRAHTRLVQAHERRVRPEPSKHAGRLPIPEHLERVEEVLEPEEDTTGLRHIGDEVTETLEYTPGRLWVRRLVRRKYARPEQAPDAGIPAVVIAPMPDEAFPRLKAGVSLLTYLVVSKFTDHLPLYRLSQMLARQGIKIPDSTLGEWVHTAIDRLEVLYAAHKHLVLTSGYLQMDETRLSVLEETKKGKAHMGYIWALYDPVNRLPFYTYLPGRSHHGPLKLLESFCGHLQSDGYSVYELLDRVLPDITLVNCWAHARRKFFEAKTNDEPRAVEVLRRIQALYHVEAEARDRHYSAEQRLALRQEKAKTLCQDLFEHLKAELPRVLPKSAIGQAIAYTLRRQEALSRYLDHGYLEIDNNWVENAMRPVALGRKNYLFAGSHAAAQRMAVVYTLLTAARHHGHDPSAWLNDVLSRLHRYPINRVVELLPQNWNPSEPG